MGYCMSQRYARFFMDATNKEGALNAIKALSDERDLVWVGRENIRNAETFGAAMDECGWDVECDKDGNIVTIEFSCEKLGSEQEIFNAIAPFVLDESYVEMSGEDGDLWRWVFADGKCQEVHPTVTW